MLKGKTVVVGVCGGIAVYKAVEIVSRLKKLGADVHVIMTENATRFVAPLTFRSISHNPVITEMFDEPKTWDIQHISLAQKADVIVVAPATANIIGKISAGIADDMLSTTIMAADAPVLFVPAMNYKMYENPIVKGNISRLTSLGYFFIEPESGLMACGTSGKGRFPSPDVIIDFIINSNHGDGPLDHDSNHGDAFVDYEYDKKGRPHDEDTRDESNHESNQEDRPRDRHDQGRDCEGLRVLVTAGPTREAIDPVRYVSNHSTGKMGYAVASAAFKRGAAVTLVTGPVNLIPPSGVEVVNVTSAIEMYNEVMKVYESYDVLIMVAAVADYRCVAVADKKIKKSGDTLVLELVKNPDIAAELGKVKGDRILVGFSAETNDLIKNASAKLDSKNMDMIVANDVTMEGAGFGTDTNIVKIVTRDGSVVDLPVMSKDKVAHRILDEVLVIKNR